jgi:hypothetical protein
MGEGAQLGVGPIAEAIGDDDFCFAVPCLASSEGGGERDFNLQDKIL